MSVRQYRVWDPLVRIFHWSLVAAFVANAVFTDDESSLHEIVGYTVAGLIAFRILWGIFGSRYARFSSFPPSVSGSMQQLSDIATGRRRAHLGHTPLGALMIYNLLAALIAISISGYMMTTNTYWGVEWVEELHEAVVFWAEISVLAHIAAVIWESRRTGVNLPRAMVTGVKTVPSEVDQTA